MSPDIPSQMIEFELRAGEPLLLGSGDTVRPLADLSSAIIVAATATVAAAADDDDNETDNRPRSPSSVCACTPVRRDSKLLAPPMTGKPNIWLSGLLSAPSLPSTSDMSPRHKAPVTGGELGIYLRTSSMLDRDALPMP